jgi:hypothetical protein
MSVHRTEMPPEYGRGNRICGERPELNNRQKIEYALVGLTRIDILV